MNAIVLKGINKYFGSNHVLRDLDLTINEGEFMTLLGPSGCGKTTTLRIIAGLEQPQSGSLCFGEKEVVNVSQGLFISPRKRDLSMVFQSFALWPHMTVFQNVAFGLEAKRHTKAQISEKVKAVLGRLHIHELSGRYPSELSGGQQQRVAIARAIVTEPKVLLLDEPLSNLDARLRIEMRSELKRLHRELKTTIIYVTHDQTEALTLSTRIAVFFDGVLTQIDTPNELYKNPGTLQVSELIGNPSNNFIDALAECNRNELIVSSELGRMVFSRDTLLDLHREQGGFPCVLAIRPEYVLISPDSGCEDYAHTGQIYTSMPAGSETLLHITVGNVNLLSKKLGLVDYEQNQEVGVTIVLDTINFYDKRTGLLIKRASY
ncbi:MAG: ABC transporter ATP-binding protein [Oscillospiraceae bacterium]|nr:ABC transporter ATP-binding protein [Oscillospiraceae bacterium]